jgi:hypothetical protein
MDMSDFDGDFRLVKYKNVSIGDETSKYEISISGYSGNIGNEGGCFYNVETRYKVKKNESEFDNSHLKPNHMGPALTTICFASFVIERKGFLIEKLKQMISKCINLWVFFFFH